MDFGAFSATGGVSREISVIRLAGAGETYHRSELPLPTNAGDGSITIRAAVVIAAFPERDTTGGQPASFRAMTPSTARANVRHRRARDSAARCPAGVSA